jgi:hypothetical protein
MKRALVLLAFGLAFTPLSAFAWGPRGHEVVAHIAAMNLTPKARAAVAGLLGGEAEAMMAINASWADEIREARPQTGPWHYVNLQLSQDMRYRPARDCPRDNCVVAQILRQDAVLRSNAPPGTKAEALKFLIHFIGDIHQPLHAADNRDRGGNQVPLRYRGQRINLHHFWDDEVVSPLGRDARTIARAIDGITPALQKNQLAGGTPVFWAEMSASIARSSIYPELGRGGAVTAREVAGHSRIARVQLARAGYALAGTLNAIFR